MQKVLARAIKAGILPGLTSSPSDIVLYGRLYVSLSLINDNVEKNITEAFLLFLLDDS